MNEFADKAQNNPFAKELAKLEPDQIVAGKYKVVSILGTGGMGTVYRVLNMFVGKDYALKTLEKQQISDSSSVRRFQTEAKAASILNHQNLVQVHDFGLLDDGQPYLVMDFVKGIDLAEHLKQKGVMEVQESVKLFAQISRGLAYAHTQGVVHRDIKPSNVMLVSGAELGTIGSVKVVDFGIAKLLNSDDGEIQALTRTGEIFGSPLYMSPEQCTGAKVDHRCDVYSLGCVLFECLTGAPPHMGQNALATMMLHQSQEPLALTEASLGRTFPADLQQIVSKMLQKNPRDRYDNLDALADDLESVCGNRPIETSSVQSVEIRKKAAVSIDGRTFFQILILTSLCFLVFGAVGGYLIRMNRGPSSSALPQTEKSPQTGRPTSQN